MLFNSYIFILVFLPVTWAVYYLLNSRRCFKMAQLTLIIASLVFYGFYNRSYLFVMIGSVSINYIVSMIGHSLKKVRIKTPWKTVEGGAFIIGIGILINLSVLFYFKYMNFFIDNINVLFGKDIAITSIVLPLGISFYTFQQISFLVDTYKENIAYEFLDYAEFVCFFPQLVAGPIVSHELIQQFRDRNRRKIDCDYVAKGLFLFSVGLLKKVIIADTLARAVDWGFSDITDMTNMDAIVVMLSYTFQIYFDFSGYSDMAVGLASMFNIEIPSNFNAPYKADSIIEFWKRWHITLTQFLRKYIYYPLGGSKKGRMKTYVNIFLVFLVSGIWHGANWTFIVWGIVHGIANICNRVFETPWNKFWGGVRWCLTFAFINFTWVIFRADSLQQAMQFGTKLFSGNNLQVSHALASCFVLPEIDLLTYLLRVHHLNITNYVIMALSIIVVFFVILKVKPFAQRTFQPGIKNMLGTIACLIWGIFSLAENSTFIYFGF